MYKYVKYNSNIGDLRVSASMSLQISGIALYNHQYRRPICIKTTTTTNKDASIFGVHRKDALNVAFDTCRICCPTGHKISNPLPNWSSQGRNGFFLSYGKTHNYGLLVLCYANGIAVRWLVLPFDVFGAVLAGICGVIQRHRGTTCVASVTLSLFLFL